MLGPLTLPPPAARHYRSRPRWKTAQVGGSPRCHPVRDWGGCGSAAGGWRRMSAGPGSLHSPMVRHRRKEAGRKLAGRLGGASSREAVTSPRRQREARAVAWKRGRAEGRRWAMAAACGSGSARGPGTERALSGVCLLQARPSCPAGHRANASGQGPGPGIPRRGRASATALAHMGCGS